MGPPRRPSRLWYWIGGGVVVLGLLGAVVWGVSAAVGFVHRIDRLQRVAVPGEGTVTFSEPGGYTLYYEAPGVSDRTGVPPFDVSLVPVGGGDEAAFADYGGSVTYALSGHDGRAIATFRIERPGDYRLRAIAGNGVQATQAGGLGRGNVAVGRGLGRGLVAAIVGSILLVILGLVIGALVITLTAVGRHRTRAQLGDGSGR